MSEKLTKTQQKNLERLGGVNPADTSFSRRDFVTKVGGTALVIGGAVGAGIATRDPWGMEGVKPPPPVKLKDYSIVLPPSRPRMVVVRSSPPRAENFATKADELQAREDQAFAMVKAALDVMGGEKGVAQFITKGDVVVIKPNVAFDKNPDLAATTQPDTLSAVVKLCFSAGARKVIVADNPINNPESCFFKTKVGEAAVRAGAELMLPKDS